MGLILYFFILNSVAWGAADLKTSLKKEKKPPAETHISCESEISISDLPILDYQNVNDVHQINKELESRCQKMNMSCSHPQHDNSNCIYDRTQRKFARCGKKPFEPTLKEVSKIAISMAAADDLNFYDAAESFFHAKRAYEKLKATPVQKDRLRFLRTKKGKEFKQLEKEREDADRKEIVDAYETALKDYQNAKNNAARAYCHQQNTDFCNTDTKGLCDISVNWEEAFGEERPKNKSKKSSPEQRDFGSFQSDSNDEASEGIPASLQRAQ